MPKTLPYEKNITQFSALTGLETLIFFIYRTVFDITDATIQNDISFDENVPTKQDVKFPKFEESGQSIFFITNCNKKSNLHPIK